MTSYVLVTPAKARLAVFLLLFFVSAAAKCTSTGSQCCSSLVPEMPPATAYGSMLLRPDDPITDYEPHVATNFDPISWAGSLAYGEAEYALSSPYSLEQLTGLAAEAASNFIEQRYSGAVSAYSHAIHLLRVNEGLYTFSQIPLLGQLIETQLKLGQPLQADLTQRRLFEVQRRNHSVGSLEILQAVEQYADWQRAAYVAELDKERYPRLVDLMDLYSAMISEVAIEEGDDSRALLPYLEGKLRVQYLISNYPGETEQGLQIEMRQQNHIDLPTLKKLRFMRMQDWNFRYGEDTINQMAEVLESQEALGSMELAAVELARGDWYQWHRRYALARNAYRQAWEIMENDPRADRWRRENFGEPLELPRQAVFLPGRLPLQVPNSSEVTAQFTVSRHGKAMDIDVRSPEAVESGDIVSKSYRFLRDLRFRPVMKNGDLAASSIIERTYLIRF